MPGESLGMELWGVVYHRGDSAESGHYVAACRGPDRVFWLFDDLCVPQRLSTDVSSYRMQQVVMMVYVRMGGGARLSVSVSDVPGGAGGASGGIGSNLDGRGGEAEAGCSGEGEQRSEAEGLQETPQRSGAGAARKRGERPSPAVGSAAVSVGSSRMGKGAG